MFHKVLRFDFYFLFSVSTERLYKNKLDTTFNESLPGKSTFPSNVIHITFWMGFSKKKAVLLNALLSKTRSRSS